MAVIPTPTWLSEQLPAHRYRVPPSVRIEERELHFDLGLHERVTADPLELRAGIEGSAVAVGYRSPPPVHLDLSRAILIDLRRRLTPHGAALADLLEPAPATSVAGSEPGTAVEPPDAITPEAAADALDAIERGDPPDFARHWVALINDPSVDERLFAALAMAKGWTDIAQTIQPGGPSAQTADALREWIEGLGNGDASPDASDRTACLRVARELVTERTGHRQARGFPDQIGGRGPIVQRGRAAHEKEVEQEMLEHGFVVLRQAIPREVVHAWIERVVGDLHRALRDQPQLAWGTTHAELLGSAAANGRFTGSIRWGTGSAMPIHLLSPRVARAVAVLCGGMERLANPFFTDQLLFTGSTGPDLRARLVDLRRSLPRWVGGGWHPSNWHLDEVRTDGMVGNQRLGLLPLVLLSDVDPEDGPTYFLPDSPGVVAGALPSTGPGIDQDDRTWTRALSLAAGAGALRTATGRAGDVFLLHPLTLHGGAHAQRPGMRVIANPNLRMLAPLDYVGTPRSPVEERVHVLRASAG